MRSILVVEDDGPLRITIAETLEEHGYEVGAVTDAESALERLAAGGVDLLLLDVRLPVMSGVDLVRRLGEEHRSVPTIVMSGEATLSEAVEVMRLGVLDLLEKPVRRDRLLRAVGNALELTTLRTRLEDLEGRLALDRRILGRSAVIEELQRRIERVGPTDASVLIQGESGTGKELVAEALHAASARRDQALVRLNCAALAPSIVEDELFGHVRGAFTGADTERAGLFEAAHRGTLLLDEIGDMDQALQAKLLRVLEDGRVRRLGSSHERRVDVRILAATHRDLLAGQGFREDLYYRLAQIPITVPSLRSRREDLPILLDFFLRRAATRYERPVPTLSAPVWERIETHPWPGNVRELAALAERFVVLGGSEIGVTDLPIEWPRIRAGAPPQRPDGTWTTLRGYRRLADARYLEALLTETGWNVSAAARIAGVDRSHLHTRLRELGLERP